jgi:hypothetical protein
MIEGTGMLKRRFSSTLSIIFMIAIVLISFSSGALFGAYILPPIIRAHASLKFRNNPPIGVNHDYHGEGEILDTAFKSQLYGGWLKYSKIDSIDELHQQIQTMFMPASFFENAYNDLKIFRYQNQMVGIGNTKIFSVTYKINNKLYTGYAYFKKALSEETKCAALIIPGTGENQSTRIISNDLTNYHANLAEVVNRYCDLFVYVKPNEDFLAIHNGKQKLKYTFIINYLLNNGGSYSSLYLVHTLAITKYLMATYDKVVLIGISQGGKAALLNTLQSRPDGAIICSGFSVLTKSIQTAGLAQIVIPNVNKDYGVDKTREIINKSPTRYLFTYGSQERGIYKIESEEECSCKFFKDLSNVTCIKHSFGHTFPPVIVDKFLNSVLSK